MNQTSASAHGRLTLSGCFAQGWKIPALNIRTILRLWGIPLIIAVILQAIAIEALTLFSTQSIVPAYRLFSVTGNSDIALAILTHNLWLIVGMGVSAAAALVATYVSWGQLAAIRRHHLANGELPVSFAKLRISRAASVRHAQRLFASDALFALLGMAVAALFAILAFKVSAWALVPAPVALIYIMCAALTSRILHAVGALPLRSAVSQALTRLWGRGFVVQLLAFFPWALITVIAWLLPATYFLSALAASDSSLMGDVPTFSPWLGIIFVLLNTLAFAFAALAKLPLRWSAGIRMGNPAALQQNNDINQSMQSYE